MGKVYKKIIEQYLMILCAFIFMVLLEPMNKFNALSLFELKFEFRALIFSSNLSLLDEQERRKGCFDFLLILSRWPLSLKFSCLTSDKYSIKSSSFDIFYFPLAQSITLCINQTLPFIKTLQIKKSIHEFKNKIKKIVFLIKYWADTANKVKVAMRYFCLPE